MKIVKTALWKSITQSGNKRYLSSLQDIVDGLNHRSVHVLGGRAPADITPQLQPEIFQLRYGQALEAVRKLKPKLKLGTVVRLRLKSSGAFQKGFVEQFSRELYKIVKISKAPPTFLYHLEDFSTGQRIAGRYYSQELSPVYLQ